MVPVTGNAGTTTMVFRFILTLFVSFLSGTAAKKLKIPAPRLVGGILGTAVYTLLSGQGICLPSVRFWLQIISGTYIGSTIGRADLAGMREIILPAFFLVSAMLVVNLFLGTIINAVSGFGILTALMGTVPGGVTETTVIADQMGADVSVVAVMQMMRSVTSISVFPFVIRRILRGKRIVCIGAKSDCFTLVPSAEKKNINLYADPFPSALACTGISLVIGTAGGWLGNYFPHIPAGPLVGSMLATTVCNITVFHAYVPLKMKRFAQVLTGVYIGTKVTRAVAASLAGLIVPIVIMFVGQLLLHTLTALGAAVLFRQQKDVMLFSCIPAGASDIALVASELGCDSPKVALYQLLRLVSCILLFPPVIKLFSGL